MNISEMTREDFKKALDEIKEVESTGILPTGIVREISKTQINKTNNSIDDAMKKITKEALIRYVKTYKPIKRLNPINSWKEDLCCGNCMKPFYFEYPNKFCMYCGAENIE